MDSESQTFPLPVVRDRPLQPRAKRPIRAILFHVLRLAIFVSVLLLIRLQHQRFVAEEAARYQQPVDVKVLREFFPDAVDGGLFDPARRTQQIVNAANQPLGFVVQTSPQSDNIVGFSGPTNLLIAFGTDERILSLTILWSRDTREHVALIERQTDFLKTWNGSLWSDAANLKSIDAVSGATLTSLAIAESIATRLGGSVPSLRFPDEIDVAEVATWFPAAAAFSADPRRPSLLHALAKDGTQLGYVFRTSPAADNVVGYQGPTDTIVALDREEKVLGIRLRHSFDNEPYVRYVKDEDYFLNLFNGRSLAELAKLDLFEARVEGVSGATMTSMTVADAVVLAAQQAMTEVAPPAIGETSLLPNAQQLSTIAIVLAGLVVGFTRLRKFRFVRLAILLGVVSIPGLLNGDMLSQATLIGWTQNGVPWTIALGLVTVSAVAFLVPILSKQQVYCHQLCPHGAIQQLVNKRLPWQWKIPNWLRRSLTLLPYGLLCWCVLVGMLHLPFSLVDVEPFDAWVFQAAGAATINVAIVGLVASLFVPMAYCRYGCPTGALLGYLRFNARSDTWSRSDSLATALLLFALAMIFAAPQGSISAADVQQAENVTQTVFKDHKPALQWLTFLSGIFFVGSLVAVPWLVAKMPADYFVRSSEEQADFRHQHPVVAMAWRILRNLLGGVLLLAGVAMLVLPGQGLLTILLGIMLIDFPGKRRLEIFLIRRPSIHRVVRWIRRRAGRDDLQLPS